MHAQTSSGGAKPRISFPGCPLCGAKGWREIKIADCTKHALYRPVVPKKIRWLECDVCRHVYTDGYFSDDVLAQIFSRTHDNQVPGFEVEQQRQISARIVERVAQRTELGTWLDVGFGNGGLLITAEEWGFTPVGLDLRASSVEALKKLGIAAQCKDIADIDPIDNLTVISMADVLEHMPSPPKGLKAAHRLLQPGGVVFLSMPNYNCAAWKVLERSNAVPYWMELEHYHNFSRDRLYRLLEEHAFEPINYAVSERYRLCMEVIARRR